MPLRLELYKRLMQRFHGHVLVAAEGERMESHYVVDGERRRRLVVDNPGEYYVLSCCYCGDTRRRLWINHMWGLRDPETHTLNLWLCNCFNEGCFKGRYDRQLALYRHVFDDVRSGQKIQDVVLRPPPSPPRCFESPGQVVPIQELPANHPAVVYMRSRGYDPLVFGPCLGVGYCAQPEAKFYLARDRIIIPIVFRGELVSWQARYVGDPDRQTPKYLTMPGTKKTQILYNYDVAAKSPFVVVCEGVTDVWSFGREAVALFGKKISGHQTRLIPSTWQHGTVVILLDGDATDEAQEIYDALGSSVDKKVIVTLPAGKDPGDYDPLALRRLVYDCVRREGVELPMTDMGPPPGASQTS